MDVLKFNEKFLLGRELMFESMLGMEDHLDYVPLMECQDGFNMSVQAGRSTYCTPRDSVGPWTHVEVGFPSEKVEMLMEYAETPLQWSLGVSKICSGK